LNICIEDPAVTRPLREHLFGVHTGEGITGGGGDMYKIYTKWKEILVENNSLRSRSLKKQIALESPIASLVEFLQESPAKKNWD
jgi:hypothetical protein